MHLWCRYCFRGSTTSGCQPHHDNLTRGQLCQIVWCEMFPCQIVWFYWLWCQIVHHTDNPYHHLCKVKLILARQASLTFPTFRLFIPSVQHFSFKEDSCTDCNVQCWWQCKTRCTGWGDNCSGKFVVRIVGRVCSENCSGKCRVARLARRARLMTAIFLPGLGLGGGGGGCRVSKGGPSQICIELFQT